MDLLNTSGWHQHDTNFSSFFFLSFFFVLSSGRCFSWAVSWVCLVHYYAVIGRLAVTICIFKKTTKKKKKMSRELGNFLSTIVHDTTQLPKGWSSKHSLHRISPVVCQVTMEKTLSSWNLEELKICVFRNKVVNQWSNNWGCMHLCCMRVHAIIYMVEVDSGNVEMDSGMPGGCFIKCLWPNQKTETISWLLSSWTKVRRTLLSRVARKERNG